MEDVDRDLVEGAERDCARATDDAVQASQRLGRTSDEWLGGGGVREVERECPAGVDPEIAEPARVAPGEREMRAAGRERSREGPAHAARGSDDQNPCPVE